MFTVRVSDNFHHMDEDETYTQGEYATWAEAVAVSRRIVDRCLAEYQQPGMTAEALFSRYAAFGEDPLIVPTPEGEKFSAWDYAQERCAALCG